MAASLSILTNKHGLKKGGSSSLQV